MEKLSTLTLKGGFGGGWAETQEGGNICILMANSWCCMVEANTKL